MIWNIPIEPLEERYSSQWDRWFKQYFDQEGLQHREIYGKKTSGTINLGSFLDVVETIRYKSQQIEKITEIVPEIKKGDVFFFHDIWHPGIISLSYMLDCLGIRNDVKITGCLHAGSYDQYDFLYKSGCDRWAKKFEESVFEIADKIFVATNFHKKLIEEQRKIDSEKIIVTRFPMFDEINYNNEKKEDIVVFPHRLDSEKQPEKFDFIAGDFFPNTWRFSKTKLVCQDKKEYYDFLKKAKISVSFALQETWGIAMIESVYAGCIPLVPDRLSYSELYPESFKYKDHRELMQKMCFYMSNSSNEQIQRKLFLLKKMFLDDSKNAMRRILNELR